MDLPRCRGNTALVLFVCFCGLFLILMIVICNDIEEDGLRQVPHGEDSDTIHNLLSTSGDRIVEQLRMSATIAGRNPLHKVIYDVGLAQTEEGYERLDQEKCPIRTCYFTQMKELAQVAALVVIRGLDPVEHIINKRKPSQIWMLHELESPPHKSDYQEYFKHNSKWLNWTATFRSDSTIVTPYDKWVPYKHKKREHFRQRNFAAGKTKLAAWFVSNCRARNARLEFAKELSKYMDLDIYGDCGDHTCPREEKSDCLERLRRKYKFYLAFENSNCQYYVTEKLFETALRNDVVPIVMGARKEDYAAVAPPGSYIHVEDYPDAKSLAQYLHYLDKHDDLYNEYFKWQGTGEFINTKMWCRVCAMLHYSHENKKHSWYENLQDFWSPQKNCVKDRWDKPEPLDK